MHVATTCTAEWAPLQKVSDKHQQPTVGPLSQPTPSQPSVRISQHPAHSPAPITLQIRSVICKRGHNMKRSVIIGCEECVCVCINHCKKVTPIRMAPCEWLWHFMLQFYGLWTRHGVEVLKWENCVTQAYCAYSIQCWQDRTGLGNIRQNDRRYDRNRMCSVESADGFIFTECISSERRPNFSHHRSIVYNFRITVSSHWITIPHNGAISGYPCELFDAALTVVYTSGWLMSTFMDLCWQNK